MNMPAPTTWPAELTEVFDRALVCHYASLTRDGRPVTWPVTPYAGPGGTLDVSTGLAYPDKAERARRDPRVALLCSAADQVVLVQGRASVRDADLQANTDRYVRESFIKAGAGFRGLPWFLVKRLSWYFARIWVQVAPERIMWWPGGDLSRAPQLWVGPANFTIPASDPAPTRRSGVRSMPPTDWRAFAERAVRLGDPIITMVVDGLPVVVPARSAMRTEQGYELLLPAGIRPADGPVCLTFHRHGPALEWQENVVLVGAASAAGDRVSVQVERALTDWSLAGTRRERRRSFLGRGKVLRKRLADEAARRGQPVPRVRRV